MTYFCSMESIINPIYFDKSTIAALKATFNSNTPCKHIIMDNFLTEKYADLLYENFPKLEDMHVKRKSLNEDKKEEYNFDNFHPVFNQVREAIRSQELIDVWHEISGLENLECTLDGYGTGIHQGANGSFVDVHLDYNMHTEKNLHRRLNILIYLNKHWKEEYGGHLELWDGKVTKMEKAVLPSFNKAVIFRTDELSQHGVRKVTCPENESRKSFYGFYFNAIGKDFNYRDSKFTARPEEGIMKGMVVEAKEFLKINAKRALKAVGISKLDFGDKN